MKVILIGKTGCGKTTLIQRLESRAICYAKTQAVEYSTHFIDTPGEYLEQKGFYKALISTAVDADVIALVQDCTAGESIFPPQFAAAFGKEVVGIVTKIDLASSPKALEGALESLREAGAETCYQVSALENTGMEALGALIFGREG